MLCIRLCTVLCAVHHAMHHAVHRAVHCAVYRAPCCPVMIFVLAVRDFEAYGRAQGPVVSHNYYVKQQFEIRG